MTSVEVSTSLSSITNKVRVGIVGGGITGAVAAHQISTRCLPETVEVHVFDQGRRGPGGRASHRSVDCTDHTILADDDVPPKEDSPTFQFDHGCQFFRADSSEMQNELLQDWLEKGWVAPWKARFGCVASSTHSLENDDIVHDFFGIPSSDNKDVYIGVGGMHQVPRKVLQNSAAVVHKGTRVTSVQRNPNQKWDLYVITGNAAYHDTPEKDASLRKESKVGFEFEVVIFTDISSASDAWHRASAGIPEDFRKQVPCKARLPLFSCMIAFDRPIGTRLPFDAFTVFPSLDGNDSAMWFAARSNAKPGFPSGRESQECWTVISTPAFAVQEIKQTTMRDHETGAFRPQENVYLNSVPGPALVDSFRKAVTKHIVSESSRPFAFPKVVYLQAQRWGSGLPVPESISNDFETICDTVYASSLHSSLVYPRPRDAIRKRDFVADDTLRLYYAGDFCSHRNPGFEAAALSGLDVAKHVSERITHDNSSH